MVDLKSYREQRNSLLAKISETLSKDERIIAAWLTGSLGRNEADSLSDIDISLVISEQYASNLCKQPAQVSADTTTERFALFSQFGAPALIHENDNNAPEGGTFTFILYAGTAIMVDWVMVPQSKASRPIQSKLLFDKIGIPLSPAPEPEKLERSKKAVTDNWTFFWMMAAVTIKYIHRNDDVFVTQWTEHLHRLFHEIERLINREPWKYTRGSLSKSQPSHEKQIESIRELCNRMLALKPQVSEFIESEPVTPTLEIEILFSLIHNSNSQS